MTRLNDCRRILLAVLSLVVLVMGAGVCLAQATEQAVATAPATAAVMDPKAEELLKSTADFFKSADTASFTMITHMNAEGRGMKQEMQSTHSIALQKPNKMAVVVKEGMQGGSVISDGEKLYVHIPVFNKYSQEDAPQNLAELSENPMVMGIAQFGAGVIQLFAGMDYDKILEGVKEASYVGQEQLDGKDVHHLKVIQEGMDMEIWVSAGEQPLPVKVKPDLAKQFAKQNMPDMKVDAEIMLADWKINEPLAADAFAFAPPEGAQKVDSAMEIFGGGGGGDDVAAALKGKPAPAFELDLLSGGKADLAQHKGKEDVILHLRATWCPPCVEGLPIVNEVAKSYADKGVVFYAVNQQEDQQTIEKFLKEKNLDLKVALDTQGKVGNEYGVTGIPQTVIIGKDGNIAAVHVGFNPNLKQQLSKELEQALNGQADAATPASSQ